MKQLVIILLFALGLVACGPNFHESVSQKAEKAQIKFTGNFSTAVVSVDGGAAFTVDKENHIFTINSGSHTILVKKNNIAVVNRTIVLDNGVTTEIEIP